MALIGQDIAQAKQLLEQGQLVAIPTETVYGLAGNALNPDAVLSIFTAKDRPSFDPLIVHTDSIEKAERWVKYFPTPLKSLAKEVWPGPLTILLPKKELIPDIVTSGLETVGIRIPHHPLTLSLLQSLDFPLAAPSANPFGYISPTQAEHVNQQLGDLIPYILDGGACQVGIESTIVAWENNRLHVLRLGGLSVEVIETLSKQKVVLNLNQSSNPQAPGMLKSHYAPRKPMHIGNIDELIKKYKDKRIGVLSFQRDVPNTTIQRILSPTGDTHEASKNLFRFLRELDQSEAEVLITEFVPEYDLGRAINDRLQRATYSE
ncbi:MAG: threonylcarbamoyl-AMP synthase [Chitinophagaceae bacterium]|nr:threonylcarbamoyl-AMP synthase [Chitinophagaceae bacterium]